MGRKAYCCRSACSRLSREERARWRSGPSAGKHPARGWSRSTASVRGRSVSGECPSVNASRRATNQSGTTGIRAFRLSAGSARRERRSRSESESRASRSANSVCCSKGFWAFQARKRPSASSVRPSGSGGTAVLAGSRGPRRSMSESARYHSAACHNAASFSSAVASTHVHPLCEAMARSNASCTQCAAYFGNTQPDEAELTPSDGLQERKGC
jgi:hypothetical protein